MQFLSILVKCSGVSKALAHAVDLVKHSLHGSVSELEILQNLSTVGIEVPSGMDTSTKIVKKL